MNRSVFFDRVRASARLYGGSLTQAQVNGLNAILDAAAAFSLADVRHLAYALATALHETSRTMLPIKEYGGTAYFTRLYDVKGERPDLARKMGNTTPGDGPRYCGRGYVQLTWKVNYERASDLTGLDLVASPDLAMRPDLAALIMFDGMRRGWFTGKKLADYFSATVDDPVNARRIINGTDDAGDIAEYHASFLAALKAAGWSAKPAPAEPPPNPAPEPAPAPTPPSEAASSFWASLGAFLARLFTRS